ncbi:arabinofuranosyltransferase AftA [Mycolicibacterium sp. NCC-Tsukiji]|nr:arabinofuranosyltransferase AftA [Mycolicibacterium sp. TY81]GCA98358.1 arabinofuranosyltransferase AftA [Mycolicibacterium sp. NCC-Tsukiji]
MGQVVCLVALVGAGCLWRRGRQLLARLIAVVSLAAFVVVTLGIPLGGTKLYLFGISVDQQFRTEYLTRLTDSPALADMTYTGLPAFYSPGWFWIGGRAAHLAGMPGWEVLKPWAITSIAIAAVLAFVLWSALVKFEHALIVTAATTATMLASASAEPYSAIITTLLPPVLVLAWSGLRAESGGHRAGGWAAVIGVGMFLGVTATFYTLLFGLGALTVTVMAALLAVTRRSTQPLVRLTAMGTIAIAIGLTTWSPFLLRVVRAPVSNTGSPWHYLPAAGAVLTFPMLQFTLLGALCMLGTLWLVVRARSSVPADALAIGVVTVYLWSPLSMLATLEGTTLLSFRLQPTLTTLLAAAGAFGFIEATQALAHARPAWSRNIVVMAAVVGAVGAIAFVCDIPNTLRPDLVVAYADTDGDGHRADGQSAGVERYYAEIDKQITSTTGRPRNQTVVMTADYGFLAIYPYWGFQGLTPHYANPLAQFDTRATEIESWPELTTSAQLAARLDGLPWPAPTVFLMHRGADKTYTLRLAKDVYPNQPNVKRYTIELDSALFDGPQFTVIDIGPFTLAVRTLLPRQNLVTPPSRYGGDK